jgi:hypothetical protein
LELEKELGLSFAMLKEGNNKELPTTVRMKSATGLKRAITEQTGLMACIVVGLANVSSLFVKCYLLSATVLSSSKLKNIGVYPTFAM